MKTYTAYAGGASTISLDDLITGISMNVNGTITTVFQTDVVALLAEIRTDGAPYTEERIRYLAQTDAVFAARLAAAFMSGQYAFIHSGRGIGTPREYYVAPFPKPTDA